MIARESVKRRLESQEGISFTEFSYMLLQAYDFLMLYDRHGCTLQMGGSDQWGNIVSGADLIRRLRSSQAHGLVSPLVTTASGTKVGKTEAGMYGSIRRGHRPTSTTSSGLIPTTRTLTTTSSSSPGSIKRR